MVMTAAAWICIPKIRPPSREAKAKFWASVFSATRESVCVVTVLEIHPHVLVADQQYGNRLQAATCLSSALHVQSFKLEADSWDHKSLLTYSNYLPDWRNTVSDGEVSSPAAFLLIGSQLLENRRSLTHEHKHYGSAHVTSLLWE